jgi:two-component system, NarL family, nitrate/nitrite response regulator NarL
MTVPERIRVAVFDDHPLFREGVAHTIRNSKGLEIVAESGCANDALRIAKNKLPDIILIDVSMSGNSLETARTIVSDCPSVKVVILTASESEDHVNEALAAGAQGYVLKGVGGLELIGILQALSRGGSYVAPGLAARLLTKSSRPITMAAKKDAPALTKREWCILDLVSRGLANKEVARTLGVTDKTVKHYMTNIMQKLQVRNRVEAVLALQKMLRH